MTSPQIIGDEHLRAMGLGLAGAHRTGKTTLADALVEANKCAFVSPSRTGLAKEMGITLYAGMPMSQRLDYQEALLKLSEAAYAEQNGFFVTDRTPIDFAAYALTDWSPVESTQHEEIRLGEYVAMCLDVTNRYFFHIGVLQPGIPYTVEPGKPEPRPLYQEFLNTLIIGLCMDSAVLCNCTFIPRRVIDLNERLQIIAGRYTEQVTLYSRHLEKNLVRQ
jgi:hypothetical protein